MILSLIFFLIFGLILIFQFKSIFLKMILLVYWYPLITMLLFTLNIPLGSSLDFIGRPKNEPHGTKALIVAVAGFYTFLITMWSYRNRDLMIKKIKISEQSRLILIALLITVSIIAFPKAFGVSNQRWNLIPGPWPVIFIAINVILYLSQKKMNKISSILHLLIMFVCLIGGERVNVIVLLGLMFLSQDTRDGLYMTERKFSKKTLLFFLVFICVGIISGIKRSGDSVTLIHLLYNIVSIHTVQDVVHIYLSSFGYLKDKGTNFLPVINEIGSLFYIPVIGGNSEDNIYNFTEILRKYMNNYGGGLFYTEGNMVFGNFGVLIYGFLYAIFLKWIFGNHKGYYNIVLAVFLVLQMRIQWYGLVYVYTPIWFSILLFEILRMLSNVDENKIKF